MTLRFFHLLVLTVSFLLTGCNNSQQEVNNKPHLLIYCGITMVKPVKELASQFEQNNNCTITITQGGSEDLYQSLHFSRVGDLYLPGSSSYREKHLGDGLLKEYVYVGYNQAALIVQKNNPKKIPADIHLLANKKYATVIGNPESCSIGRQSQKILTQAGIYDAVMNNAVLIAADSRTMNKTIINKSADLIFNWGATAYFENNKKHMTRLPLDESIAPKNQLLLNLLSFSKHPELARTFMRFAVSTEGQKIFHNYGFLDSVSTPGTIQH